MASSRANTVAVAGGAGSSAVRLDRALDRHALECMLRTLTGEDDHSTLSELCGDTDALAADLAGPAPSAGVRLLAQTAALCWVELRRAEVTFASVVESAAGM